LSPNSVSKSKVSTLPSKIFHFRSYTLRIGEPENNRGFLSSGKVVGWGQTYTDADDEIKIVSTARQQKLKVPFVSNEECIERFQDFGANLENDLRFDFFCFKRLFFL